MIRMFAREGVTSFSHGGHEFEVGADGSVEVSERVAVELAVHGFSPVPPPPSDTIVVKRVDLVALLEKVGAAVNPAMSADRLAAALSDLVAKEFEIKPVKGGKAEKAAA
jgi:hypothetical protein